MKPDNDLIQEFFADWNKGEFPHWRLGQALYNSFSDYLPRPFPELFYETDEEKAMKIFLKEILD